MGRTQSSECAGPWKFDCAPVSIMGNTNWTWCIFFFFFFFVLGEKALESGVDLGGQGSECDQGTL